MCGMSSNCLLDFNSYTLHLISTVCILEFVILIVVDFNLGPKHHIPNAVFFYHRLAENFSRNSECMTRVDASIQAVIVDTGQMYHFLVPCKQTMIQLMNYFINIIIFLILDIIIYLSNNGILHIINHSTTKKTDARVKRTISNHHLLSGCSKCLK